MTPAAVEKAVSWYRREFKRSGRPLPELGLLLRERGYFLQDGARERFDPLGHIWTHAAREASEWGYGSTPISKWDRFRAARFFAKTAKISWWRVWRFGIAWNAGRITTQDLYEELTDEKSRWISAVDAR